MIAVHFSHQTVEKLYKELEIAEQLNNLRLYKITSCLLLLAEGYDYEEIAKLLNIGIKTVYNWLKRFLLERFSWLLGYHFKGRGRKSKLSKRQKERLYQMVEDGPEKNGFDCGVWNSAMIASLIEREFHVNYHPRYVCQLLKEMGLSYQRAKFISDQIDEATYRKQRKEWERKKWPAILSQARQLKAVILFGDEVSFAQWGSLARTWAPKGKQPLIKTCGKRKGLKMFGAIEFRAGDFHYMECEGKFNGESYVQFLRQILSRYSCPVILIEDGAPYHNGKIVNEFREEMQLKCRLFVHRLPAYSPDLNPIEKLWKNTKKDATHLKYFPTFEHLRQTVIKAFNKYLQDASKIVCVMKKLRAEAEAA